MQKWMDDYGAYRRFTKLNCLCGHTKHCNQVCEKCQECKDCECEECLIGKGYN